MDSIQKSLIKPLGSKIPAPSSGTNSFSSSSTRNKEMPPTKIPVPNAQESPKSTNIKKSSSQSSHCVSTSPKLTSSKPPTNTSKLSPSLSKSSLNTPKSSTNSPKKPVSTSTSKCDSSLSSVKPPSQEFVKSPSTSKSVASVKSSPSSPSLSCEKSSSVEYVKSPSTSKLSAPVSSIKPSSAKSSPPVKPSPTTKSSSSILNSKKPVSSVLPLSAPISTPRPASQPLPRTVNAMLPNEILLLVFRHLKLPLHLVTASTACLRWRAVADEPSLWKALFDARFQTKDVSPDWKQLFIKKAVNESVTKLTGKLKRATVSNTAEAMKLLRVAFRVHMNESEVPVLARDVSCFQFTTSIKCNSILHTLLKDVKKIDISVETALLNGGKPKRIAAIPIKKENLVQIELPEKSAIFLYETKVDGFHLLIGVFPGDKELGFMHITCSHLHILHSVLPSSSLVGKTLPIHHKSVFDDLDRDYGLRRYSASIVLRSSGKVKWSSYFTNIDYENLEANKYVKFVVLDGTHSPHMAHSFEGTLSLPWKTDTFSNTVPNLGMVDWLLQDESGATMWLESGAAKLVSSGTNKNSLLTPMSTIYDLPEGEIFEFLFESPAKGRIELRAVYSESEKRTTIWELIFVLQSSFLNSWFATTY